MHHIFICDIYSEASEYIFHLLWLLWSTFVCLSSSDPLSKDLYVLINLTQKMCRMRGLTSRPQSSITTTDNWSQFYFILHRKTNKKIYMLIGLDNFWHAYLIVCSILLATILKQPRKSCPDKMKRPENLYHPELNYHMMNLFLWQHHQLVYLYTPDTFKTDIKHWLHGSKFHKVGRKHLHSSIDHCGNGWSL